MRKCVPRETTPTLGTLYLNWVTAGWAFSPRGPPTVVPRPGFLAQRPLLFFVKAAVPNLHQFLRSLLSSAPPSTCQLTTRFPPALASLWNWETPPSKRQGKLLTPLQRPHPSVTPLYRQTPDTLQDVLRPNPHQEAFPDREMHSSGTLTPKAKGIATSPVHRSGGSCGQQCTGPSTVPGADQTRPQILAELMMK